MRETRYARARGKSAHAGATFQREIITFCRKVSRDFRRTSSRRYICISIKIKNSVGRKFSRRDDSLALLREVYIDIYILAREVLFWRKYGF